jgi:hypothetical protein
MKSYPHEFAAEVEPPVTQEKRNRFKEVINTARAKVANW